MRLSNELKRALELLNRLVDISELGFKVDVLRVDADDTDNFNPNDGCVRQIQSSQSGKWTERAFPHPVAGGGIPSTAKKF